VAAELAGEDVGALAVEPWAEAEDLAFAGLADVDGDEVEAIDSARPIAPGAEDAAGAVADADSPPDAENSFSVTVRGVTPLWVSPAHPAVAIVNIAITTQKSVPEIHFMPGVADIGRSFGVE